MILGQDFLEDSGAVCDHAQHIVTFPSGMWIRYNSDPTEKSYVASLANCSLPPWSETVIPVKCSEHFRGIGLIEPREDYSKDQGDLFGIARLLVKPQDGKTVCRLLNPTTKPIYLYSGQIIGTIEAPDEKFELDDNESSDDTEYFPSDVNERQDTNRQLSLDTDERQNKNFSNEQFEQSEQIISSDDEILSDLGIKIDNNLNQDQLTQLKGLIASNRDVFAKTIADLPGTDVHYHKIDTGDAAPKRQRCYKPSPIAKKEIERQTQELLENGIIEPSHSMWQSPCLLVKKKPGEMRMCIDYRQLNSVTKEISFPLPLMTDVFDAMSESQPFSVCSI